jgi:hypothetical protein
MMLLPAASVVLLVANPMTTKRPQTVTVTIEGQRRPVEQARFGIHIQARSWNEAARRWDEGLKHAEASYWLSVKVDERSGEDGALAPAVEEIPVRRAAGGRHPSLQELASLTVQELEDGSDCEEWDAWFGNDAPGLCGNVVRFQGWDGHALRLRWESHYQDGRKKKPLLVEGPVEFTGINVTVEEGQDPDEYLRRAWGAQPADTLQRHRLGRYPARRPGQTAKVGYVYLPKGAPLSGHWVVGDGPPAGTAAPVAPAAASATAAPAAAGPPRRVQDARGRFSLEAPGEWQAIPDPVLEKLGGFALRRDQPAPAATLKAVAVDFPVPMSLEEYVGNSTSAYSAIWKVEERSKATLAGKRAVRLVMLQTLGEDTKRLLKYFVKSHRGGATVLTIAVDPAAFAGRLAEFEAIALSMKAGTTKR